MKNQVNEIQIISIKDIFGPMQQVKGFNLFPFKTESEIIDRLTQITGSYLEGLQAYYSLRASNILDFCMWNGEKAFTVSSELINVKEVSNGLH